MMAWDNPAWQVYVDPDGNVAKRQHVETCPSNAAAKAITDYLTPRVADTDRVTSVYGPVDAPGGSYDLKQLREEARVPGEGHEGMAKMKPIDI